MGVCTTAGGDSFNRCAVRGAIVTEIPGPGGPFHRIFTKAVSNGKPVAPLRTLWNGRARGPPCGVCGRSALSGGPHSRDPAVCPLPDRRLWVRVPSVSLAVKRDGDLRSLAVTQRKFLGGGRGHHRDREG